MSHPPLEVVAESLAHMVWLADANGTTDYFNEIGTEYTGLPQSANLGWGWVDLIHPDDADRARLGWEHATRARTTYELSYRIRRGDGEFRWHVCRARAVPDEHGGVARWIGTADDLTDVAPADDQVRVAQQLAELHALLEGAPPPARRASAALEPVVLDSGARTTWTAAELSTRERAVARLVGEGYTNAEIARLLGVSLRTIETARATLRRVLGVSTRAELVRFAREVGLAEG